MSREMVSSSEFVGLAQKNGANVNPQVVEALYGPADSINLASTFQSGVLRGVKRACDILCEDPQAQLVDKEVPVQDSFYRDTAARTLLTIINTSRNPVTLESGADFVPVSKGIKAASCPDADGHFSPALDLLMKSGQPWGSIDSGARLVHRAGLPLFLMKNHADSTAMSLRPFTNAGVLFPAGMLCTVTLLPGAAKRVPNHIVPVESDSVRQVTPTRLLAYAFPVTSRDETNDPGCLETWPEIPTSRVDAEEIARYAADHLEIS
jgi:hypothetical protein